MYQLRDLVANLFMEYREDIFEMECGRLAYDLLEKDVETLIPDEMKHFTNMQRLEILRCMVAGVDYEPLIRYNFNARQMAELRLFLFTHFDVSLVCDPRISDKSMRLVRKAFTRGLNLSGVDIKAYNPEQLNQIILGIQQGLDVTPLLNPDMDYEDMNILRNKLAQESTKEVRTTDRYRQIHRRVFGE